MAALCSPNNAPGDRFINLTEDDVMSGNKSTFCSPINEDNINPSDPTSAE